MPTNARSSKRKDDTLLIVGAVLAAGAAIAFGVSKIKPEVNLGGGFGGFDFSGLPGFDFSELFASSGGSQPLKLDLILPPIEQTPPTINFDLPSSTGFDASGVSDSLAGGFSQLVDSLPKNGFSFDIPEPGQAPYLAAIGKLKAVESVTDLFYKGGVEVLTNATPLEAVTAVSAVQGLGVAITKSSVKAVAEPAAKGVLGPLATEARVGLGLAGASVGIGITGAVAAASAGALIEEKTPGTLSGFGASFGLLGVEGLTLLGAVAAAPSTVAAVALGGAGTAAGIGGAFLGDAVNNALNSAGFVDRPLDSILNIKRVRSFDSPRTGGSRTTTPGSVSQNAVVEDAVTPEPGTGTGKKKTLMTGPYTPAKPSSIKPSAIPAAPYTPAINYSPAIPYTPAGGYK